MTHTYDINGITCSGCVASIKTELLKVPDLLAVEVDENNKEATIKMQKHISIAELQHAVSKAGSKYFIKEKNGEHKEMNTNVVPMPTIGFVAEEEKSWIQTYKPVLVLFGIIALVSILVDMTVNGFEWMNTMRIFMAGFFLSFSFFKFLDLNGFADSYSSYDIIAKRWRAWSYLYAFIELTLGLMYAINFEPIITNAITFIVMSISVIGVFQSVLNKQKIQCACLGTVFNLPMSTLTIIEDGLMIFMSVAMLFTMF
jgi:copper chaperone CopZ